MNTDNRIRRVKIADLELHPQADLIPSMSGNSRKELRDDIDNRGIKVPIEVSPGTTRILDGRHRWQIADELYGEDDEHEHFLDGCVPVVDAELNGEDELTYMVKSAMIRRHLTKSQRADLAVRWMEQQDGTTKKILSEKGKTGGKGNKKPKGLPKTGKPFDRRKEATELYDVSKGEIDKAKKRKKQKEQTEQEPEEEKPPEPKLHKYTIWLNDNQQNRLLSASNGTKPQDWIRRQTMKAVNKILKRHE